MPKGSDKSKPKENEKLELWKSRIAAMKTYMREAGNRKKWRELKQFYNGDYTVALNLKKNVAVVVVNLVYSFVRSAVADLFVRNPKFKCNPKTTEGVLKARVGEVAINYYWYINKIKRQVKKTLKEAKLLGYSWIKVGYEGEIGMETGDGEGSEYIKKEDIFAVYCKHDAVCYDPNAQDAPHDAGWMFHTYLKPTEKLKKKYDKNIKSTSDNFYDDTKKSELKPKDTEMSRIYEIWDKENDEILVYCDGYPNDFLEEKVWSKVFDEVIFPFSMLNFDTLIDQGDEAKDNIPEPEINQFISQILEKMKFRSIQISHIKRFCRQLLSKKDALSEDEKQKFKDGLDGAIIELEEGSPADAVLPASYPPIQTDIYAVENKIDMDLDRLSGRPAFTQGISTQTKSRTLGELEAMQSGANSRLSEEQDTVEEFTEEVAKKMLKLMRQFFDKKKYARIITDVTALDKALFEKKGLLNGSGISYDKNSLPSEEEGDIEIVAGSTLPMNPQNRVQNLFTMAKVGPAFGLVPGSLASMTLGQAIVKEMELKDVEKAYNTDIENALKPKTPSPKEQLEMIDKKQKVDKNAVDTQLKKTRVEGNNLSNVMKALKNSAEMKGENKPKPAQKAGGSK